MARGSDRRVLSAVTIYNEIEPYAADWLENLIAAGHIAPGTVDRRSIAEITPDDLKQATQFRTFAGIGLWSYALRLAGWPADVPVWTGSCPCQPFSSAGKGLGTEDHRHLWPVWFRLIRESRPPWIFGEQVSGSAGLDWFGSVSADLESAGYAVAGADLPACSVGAPHRRQRLFFVAVADSEHDGGGADQTGRKTQIRVVVGGSGSGCHAVAHSDGDRSQGQPSRNRTEKPRNNIEGRDHVDGRGHLCGLADAQRAGNDNMGPGQLDRPPAGKFDRDVSAWDDVEWLACSDGTSRPCQPGLRLLVDGYPARRSQLRALGNAIVPQVAAAFIRSAAEAAGLACEVD